MKKIIIIILICVSLYFSARILLVWNSRNSESETRVSFEIPPGSSLNKISQILLEKELIRDSFVFRIFAIWNGFAKEFQAGSYVIQKNLTFSEISEFLQKGKSKEIKITIPEGSTIAQIDQILYKKNLIDKEEFIDCANFCNFTLDIDNFEGFLWPSTYFVNTNNFSVKSFISRLYKNFEVQLAPFDKNIKNSKRSKSEIIIVASMIEKEAFTKEEMPKIADVIWKRLDEKIPLGIDATTRYAKKDWKAPLYKKDFETNSPYNTRKKLGLPPTAISNPGIHAIKAAIFPEKTEFYYYLHDKNGQIHFSKTLEEHNRKKIKYL